MQSETPARKHEGTRHPARFQTQESAAGIYRFLNLSSIGHVSLGSISNQLRTLDNTTAATATASVWRLVHCVLREQTQNTEVGGCKCITSLLFQRSLPIALARKQAVDVAPCEMADITLTHGFAIRRFGDSVIRDSGFKDE